MQQLTIDEQTKAARTPLWRRITAFFTLGSMVIATGVVLAALIATTILMMLFLLERAIS